MSRIGTILSAFLNGIGLTCLLWVGLSSSVLGWVASFGGPLSVLSGALGAFLAEFRFPLALGVGSLVSAGLIRRPAHETAPHSSSDEDPGFLFRGSGKCRKCKGKGFFMESWWWNERKPNLSDECKECRGTGVCKRCEGTGFQKGYNGEFIAKGCLWCEIPDRDARLASRRPKRTGL
jgi:hypothetical protein